MSHLGKNVEQFISILMFLNTMFKSCSVIWTLDFFRISVILTFVIKIFRQKTLLSY